MHLQSARDVYYRFTLHYKKENLVVERNLGDFLFIIRTINKQIKELGRDIVGMDADNKYGSGFYKCLSNDLKEELPGVDGLSPSNLRYTKRFYLLYNELVGNFQQVAENSDERLKSVRSSCPRQ